MTFIQLLLCPTNVILSHVSVGSPHCNFSWWWSYPEPNKPNWKEWNIESSLELDVMVKFWTGWIPDQDIELYLIRYYKFCNLQNVRKY